MKKFLLAIAAVAACFSASAFTVEEICGEYDATGINLSQNFGIYKPGTTSTGVFPGLESTSWTMTITQVEGNKVKLSNFIPTGLNKDYADKGYTDGFPAVSFDIEGEFDGDKTITLNYTLVTYTRPDFASVKMPQNITKYDGATAFGTTCDDYKSEFPKTFTATFDENKNLTVEPWASYNNSAILNLLPTYGADNTVGTYFTRESSGIEAIEADTEAPVEYYNLQGVRVADPTPGLYIRRQGNKVTKVIVK